MNARFLFFVRLSLCVVLLALITLTAQAQPAPNLPGLDSKLFSGMKARSIGPAGMSGRIADIQAVVLNPDIIYVGVSIGGVWKSVNGGTTFKPIFDNQPVAAIGSIAIFQSNPSIVWVSTGEGNPRNSASVGNGVYKSLDGGDTWMHMGLDKTERIHRIVLHPSDPNVAYAAAMGQMWGENPDRGVFKTTDRDEECRDSCRNIGEKHSRELCITPELSESLQPSDSHRVYFATREVCDVEGVQHVGRRSCSACE